MGGESDAFVEKIPKEPLKASCWHGEDCEV